MDVRRAAFVVSACGAAAAIAARGCRFLHDDDLRSVAILAATAAAGLIAALLADRIGARRRMPAARSKLEELLRAAAAGVVDVVLAFDGAGRLVWAAGDREPAPRLDSMLGAPRTALGDDLAILLQGLARGPAAGRVTLLLPGGRMAARALAVRRPGRVALDIVLLRFEQPPAALPCEVVDSDLVHDPPPLPRAGSRQPAPEVAGAAPPPPGVGALAGPIGRATAAAALMRMALPPGMDFAAEHLARVEAELRGAEAALAALTAPLPPPSRNVVDLDTVLSEVLARARIGPGVQVTRSGTSARALADASHLRRALRDALQLAIDAMPSGGALSVRTTEIGDRAVIDIADSGPVLEGGSGIGLLMAARLVAAQDGRLERTSIPGRGSLCRIALPAAVVGVRAAAAS